MANALGKPAPPMPEWMGDSMNGVERRIVGFHQGHDGHWVADLECGHTQHVRHDPPWINRTWTTTAERRVATVGKCLACKKCDPPPPS
jgi:hypothetical protein